VVGDQTVEKVDIVFAQSAEILELVDGGVLQTKLGQASCLLGLVALGARRSQAVCAQVLANVRRVGGVIVGVTRKKAIARLVN
jgi:hypothetical protein